MVLSKKHMDPNKKYPQFRYIRKWTCVTSILETLRDLDKTIGFSMFLGHLTADSAILKYGNGDKYPKQLGVPCAELASIEFSA